MSLYLQRVHVKFAQEPCCCILLGGQRWASWLASADRQGFTSAVTGRRSSFLPRFLEYFSGSPPLYPGGVGAPSLCSQGHHSPPSGPTASVRIEFPQGALQQAGTGNITVRTLQPTRSYRKAVLFRASPVKDALPRPSCQNCLFPRHEEGAEEHNCVFPLTWFSDTDSYD